MKKTSDFLQRLLLSLAALLLLLGPSCQGAQGSGDAAPTPSPTKGERLEMVWEAWGILEEAYGDDEALDRERAVEGAILGMLRTVDHRPYPFLTELHTVEGEPPKKVPPGLEDIWHTWVLLRERHADATPEEIAEAAVQGLTEGLDDPHAGFMTQEEYAEFRLDSSGEYEGIGAYVGIVDGRVTFTHPIPGGPAAAAGLLAGDVLMAVDGEPVKSLALEEVVARVRGSRGSQVELSIQRADEEELLSFYITRDVVDVPSVTLQELPLQIGHIRIFQFVDDTADELERLLQVARDQGLDGLVLDLRDNPGGSIQAAVQVAGQFLDGGLVMYELDAEQRRSDWEAERGGLAVDIPLAVVVSESTASAAEVVAGALQDRGRARLFGHTTYGKGAVQVFRQLSDGSALRVTSSYWYTPSGQQFQERGIAPDEEVSLQILQETPGGGVRLVDVQLRAAYTHVLDLLGRSLEDLPSLEALRR